MALLVLLRNSTLRFFLVLLVLLGTSRYLDVFLYTLRYFNVLLGTLRHFYFQAVQDEEKRETQVDETHVEETQLN